MGLQNTARVQNCYVTILLIVCQDILIPRNPEDGWRLRMQVLPGLVVWAAWFKASCAFEKQVQFCCLMNLIGESLQVQCLLSDVTNAHCLVLSLE